MARMRLWVILVSGTIGAVSTIAALGFVGQRATEVGGVAAQARDSFELPECQKDWEYLPKRLGGSIGPEGFSIVGPITDVPEFHDCQRLLSDGGRRFGPLVAVFAAYDLDSIVKRLDSLNERRSGPADRFALAGGLILNLSKEAYARLDIQPGFSCLYVWRTRTDSVRWNARIRWVRNRHTMCLDPIDPTTLQAGRLDVHRDSAPEFSQPGDYPAVARWEWDAVNGQHYIGIKCGHGWCQVGPPRFRPTLSYAAGPTDGTPRSKVQRIKGWYDEQILADSLNRPSIRGWVFPSPDLHERRLSDFDSPNWVLVAYVALERQSDFYKARFNYDVVPPGAPLERMNKLFFCRGTMQGCGIPTGSPAVTCGSDVWWPNPRMWVRIDAALGGRSMYRCIIRRGHEDLRKDIPSTTRWRWLAHDETSWIECGHGCCEMAAFY
jgi:hypothetical protein